MTGSVFPAVWPVLLKTLLIIPVGFILYAVLSYLMADFGYPLAENWPGALNIFLICVLCGFIFSLASGIGIGARPDPVALIAAGLACAGLLRLYALGQSLYSPHRPTSQLFDRFLVVGISLALSFVFVVSPVLPESIASGQSVAQSTSESRAGQPTALFLVAGSFLVLMCVELVWMLWSRLPASQERGQRAVERAMAQNLAQDPSGILLRVLTTVTSRSGTFTIPEIGKALQVGDEHLLDQAVRLLADTGQVLRAGGQAWRRHPHLFRYQRELLGQSGPQPAAVDGIEGAVEEALRCYRDAQALAASPLAKLGGVRDYCSLHGVTEGLAVQALMTQTFEQLRAVAGEPGSTTHTVCTYVDLRFRQGMPVSRIARELGYSREHLYRSYHQRAVAEFEQAFLRRATGSDRFVFGLIPSSD